jgi:hypothetical protein
MGKRKMGKNSFNLQKKKADWESHPNRQARRNRSATHPGKPASITALTTVPLFKQHQLKRGQLYYDYAQALTGAAPLGLSTRFFFANSVYDPDATGVGHQAMGFDQMMVFYEHFAVVGAHIKVSFLGTAESANAMRVAIWLSPDAVVPTDPIRVYENGLIKTGVCDTGLYSGSGGVGTRSITLTLDCDVANYFGKSRAYDILDDEKLTGSVTANPVEGVYFGVSVWNAFEGVYNSSVAYDVLISYDVIYFEPRKATVSMTEEKRQVQKNSCLTSSDCRTAPPPLEVIKSVSTVNPPQKVATMSEDEDLVMVRALRIKSPS